MSFLFFVIVIFTMTTTMTSNVLAFAPSSVFASNNNNNIIRHHRRPSFTSRRSPTTTTASTLRTRLHMFTGIIEEMGTVVSLHSNETNVANLWDGSVGESGTTLIVRATTVLQGAYVGCSIAVNGVCLTVTEFGNDYFKVGLASETLRKTNLGFLTSGDRVNLERAAEVMSTTTTTRSDSNNYDNGIIGRNSGHFVQGHVDECGTIVDRYPDGDSLVYRIRTTSSELIRYVVPKGFVAIDGTSLTVVDVFPNDHEFTFMLVRYTQQKITLPSKDVGEMVNIEVDVMAKYAESAMSTRMDALERHVQQLENRIEQIENGKNLKQIDIGRKK